MRWKNRDDDQVKLKFDEAIAAATDGHVVKASKIMSAIIARRLSAELTVRCWTLASLLAFDFRDQRVLHAGFKTVWGLREYDATKIIADNAETGLAFFATQLALESEIAAEGDECPDLLEHRRLFVSWARAAAVSSIDIEAAAAYADGWLAFAERRLEDAEDAFKLACDEPKDGSTRLFVRPCVRALAKADLAVTCGRDPYVVRESLHSVANAHRDLLCAPSRLGALARLVALFPEEGDELVAELTSVWTPTINQVGEYERLFAESRRSQTVASATCLRQKLSRGLGTELPYVLPYVQDLATASHSLLSYKTIGDAPISARGAWLRAFDL